MMSPSGHTLPADAGKGHQVSMPTTDHGIAVGVDGSRPSKVAVDRAHLDRCPSVSQPLGWRPTPPRSMVPNPGPNGPGMTDSRSKPLRA